MAAFIARGQAGQVLKHLRLLHSISALRHVSMSRWNYLVISSVGPQLKLNIRLSSTTSSTVSDLAEFEKEQSEYLERFVPITRKSIIRHLVQEKKFLSEKEKRQFEKFALALDAAIVNRHHDQLQELKALFDPINPDKDTIATRQWNKRERLDNEFWLLQKLGSVMSKANFHQLPDDLVRKSLEEHKSRNGVVVSVNADKYDVLSFWALGKEAPEVKLTSFQRFLNRLLRRPAPKPNEYYKRVVLACRLKRDDKLLLKAFKEVPVNGLEQLLPDGKIRMSKFDERVIYSMLGVAAAGVVAKIVTILAGVHFDWTLLVTGVTGLAGFQAWTTYKNRHLAYLNEHSRMMFFKNVANNRGLLTLLVDRAEDEVFKEALMVYTFLLTNRPPSALIDETSETLLPAELGGISQILLEKRIEEWVKDKTGHIIEFESDEAVKLLSEFGILSEDYNNDLHVLTMDAAQRNLPLSPRSITTRIEEYDIVEGYDRDITDETEDEYKQEDKKRKKYGWF